MHIPETRQHSLHFGKKRPSSQELELRQKISALCGGDLATSSPKYSPLMDLTPRSPVSRIFAERVDRAIKLLPPYVQEALLRKGWRIKLGQILTDICPELKGKETEGWDEGDTWDMVNGVCLFHKRHIALTEFYWDRKKPIGPGSKFAKSKNLIQSMTVEPEIIQGDFILKKTLSPYLILRHESGHALDKLLKWMSSKKELQTKYGKDYEQFDSEKKQVLYYYIQPDRYGDPTIDGVMEAVAEGAASLQGGGCEDAQFFKANFKNTVDYIREQLDLLEECQQKDKQRQPLSIKIKAFFRELIIGAPYKDGE